VAAGWTIMATTVMEMAKIAASTSSTARIASRAITGSFTNNHPLMREVGPPGINTMSPNRPATNRAEVNAIVKNIGISQSKTDRRLESIAACFP